MTAYLLDTNILIYLEEPNSPYHQQIVKQLSKCTDEDVLAVSVLSFYELEYGIATRTNSSNALQVEQSRKVLQEFQEGFEVLPISLNAAKYFGQLKAQYRAAYQTRQNATPDQTAKKHDIDLLIAATAIEHKATLVSGDAIFRKLQLLNVDIKWENWMSKE